MMNMEALPHELVRANSYKLLSECYYSPNEELINLLNNLKKLKGGIHSEITKYIPSLSELGALAVDFSKLFVGPFKLQAPPYGSVYMENKAGVMGDTTIAVGDSYRLEGVEVALKEAPDHIAIELEFMYLLILKEIEAIKNNDLVTAEDYLGKQKSFLEGYLAAWIPEFADRLEINAKTQFYKNLARTTKKLVETDLKNLLSQEYHFTRPNSR
jgi:TorA maturation chaperone TorD